GIRIGGAARRRGGDREAGGDVDRRCRGRRGQGRGEGRGRGDRRYGGDAALRRRAVAGPRAADHRKDRAGVAPQQAAFPAARGHRAERVRALGDHAAADAGRRLSLLRGDGEDRGGRLRPRRACRRGGGDHRPQGAGGPAGERRGAHGLHPVGGDHGDRARRPVRAVAGDAGDYPRGRRRRDHGRRLWRRRVDREDGRHRPPTRGARRPRLRRGRAGAGQGHARAPQGIVDHRHRRDDLGRRRHHRARARGVRAGDGAALGARRGGSGGPCRSVRGRRRRVGRAGRGLGCGGDHRRRRDRAGGAQVQASV
ncbi:MAG: putative membrane protein, partial [uncultured Sphingomonadaceae bacterium]